MEEAFLAATATLALGLSPSSSPGSNISALRGGAARAEDAPRRVRSNGCGRRRRWKTEERLFSAAVCIADRDLAFPDLRIARASRRLSTNLDDLSDRGDLVFRSSCSIVSG